MITALNFPSFDEHFSDLNNFILYLVQQYQTYRLASWEVLAHHCRQFYTPDVMDAIEAKAPGWKKMASYSEGITLEHVTCVFLGMYMLPEFQELSAEQQQMAKWIILFHDIDKAHIRGQRDTMHAFHSAIVAARDLPGLGFPVTDKYASLIDAWSEYTRQAFVQPADQNWPKPDNQKLPNILSGIEDMFGEQAPATLIIKTALLHISLLVDRNYQTPAPLTDKEVKRFISPALFPLLRVMMFADNEGWSLFDLEFRDQQKHDSSIEFERIRKFISPTS